VDFWNVCSGAIVLGVIGIMTGIMAVEW